MVGLARTRNNRILEEVRSNVSYGKYGPTTYTFQAIEKVFVPDDAGRGEETSWEKEERFLQKWIEQDGDKKGLPGYIKKRLRIITTGEQPELKGLVNELFWRNPLENERLAIRRNFAFFDFDYARSQVSQADVYFTICALLHSLRGSRDEEANLLQHEHHRVLLSPRCFDRFNDGAVQAAILRAAREPEIDYSISLDQSRWMAEVLSYNFENCENEHGEATVEFLIAIATKRLRLKQNDIQSVIKPLLEKNSILPILRYLSLYINQLTVDEEGFAKDDCVTIA